MPLFEVDQLIAGYHQGFQVGPVSFAMDTGLMRIEGINGSGKTSLIRVLAGAFLPLSGQVRLNGVDLHKVAPARRDIALVASTPELPEFLTVREAWEFTASLRGQPDWDGETWCQALQLDPDLQLAKASAGQRHKAELISGLAAEPKVIILDEVFVHLDQGSVELLWNWIETWSQTRLLIFTHHGETLLQADKCLNLSNPDLE